MTSYDAMRLHRTGRNDRRHRRYHVKNVTWAVLKNGSGKVNAQVMDIGLGGLSIHCSSRLRIARTSRLDLIVSRTGFQIARLPFQAVSGYCIPPQIPLGPAKWRYGLEFGKLTNDQQGQLDALIARHTIRNYVGSVAI
jgi:hypothetical protein